MIIFTTILAGVCVFVLGQIALKWVIDPAQDFRRIRSNILFHLVHDYPVIQNAETVRSERVDEVRTNLYDLAARLLAAQQLIPVYRNTRKLFDLPPLEQIIFASQRLTLIANSLDSNSTDIHERLDRYRTQVLEALEMHNALREEEGDDVP